MSNNDVVISKRQTNNRKPYVFLVSILAIVSGIGVGSYLGFHSVENEAVVAVKQGYLNEDSKRNVAEILSMCPYLKKGTWSFSKAQAIKQVGYEAVLDNKALVSWVLPKSKESEQELLSKQLDKRDFALKLKLGFNVYQNYSFDLNAISLSYQGKELAQDKEDLLLSLLKAQSLGSAQVSAQVQADFNGIWYETALAKADSSDKIQIGLMGTPGELFTSAIFPDDKIYYSFHPLTFSTVEKFTYQGQNLSLAGKLQVLNLNDYRLNEVGLSIYSDGYGLLAGRKMKSNEEILQLISPYNYDFLVNTKLQFTLSLSSEQNIALEDMELRSLVLSDSSHNKAYLKHQDDSVQLSFKINNSVGLDDFIKQQQTIIDYTALAYPLAYAASSLAALTSEQSDRSFFSTMLTIRNKIMRQGKESIQPPLTKGQSI